MPGVSFFNVMSERSNSGPDACTQYTLPTVSSPHPSRLHCLKTSFRLTVKQRGISRDISCIHTPIPSIASSIINVLCLKDAFVSIHSLCDRCLWPEASTYFSWGSVLILHILQVWTTTYWHALFYPFNPHFPDLEQTPTFLLSPNCHKVCIWGSPCLLVGGYQFLVQDNISLTGWSCLSLTYHRMTALLAGLGDHE